MVNGVTESGGIYLYNHPVNGFNDSKSRKVNGVTESGDIYLYNHPVNGITDSKSMNGQWCY